MVFMVNVPAVSTYRPPGRSSRQRNGNVFKSEATLQNFRTLYFGKKRVEIAAILMVENITSET